MQIVIHAGAHGTEQDRLFKTLLRNKDDFSKRGVSVPGPSRYRALLRELLGAMETAPPSENARDILLDAILDDEQSDRAILSHPFLFGAERACLREGFLYDLAPLRMAQLSSLFPHDELSLFLAMRDPAAFLPALFAASPQESMNAFLRGVDPKTILWSQMLHRIREAAPKVQLVVWCFEDMPLIWSQIVRELAGLEHGEKIIGGFDLLAEIMTTEGMQRFRAYLKQHPKLNEIQKQRVISAFLAKYVIEDAIEEELEAPGWSDDTVSELTAIYEEDILECARIPGVQMIGP